MNAPSEHSPSRDLGGAGPSPLRAAVIANLPIKGSLSTGEPYEILVSRKSAVTDGVHLIFSMEIDADKLSAAKRIEAHGIVINEVEKFELARVFGYRLACNMGQLLTRPHFHIQVMIPGSDAEASAAPRLVEPWPAGGGTAPRA